VSSKISLNADVGEGMTNDERLIPNIHMANVAAGGHAGGGEILSRTIAACRENRVSIGAHPSYPDVENFGRRSLWGQVEPVMLSDSYTEQIIDVARAADAHNATISYIKPHGALYNDMATNWAVAEYFAMASVAVSERIGLPGMPALPVMALAGSTGHQYLMERGYAVIAEAFADRAYQADGSLVPLAHPGAVISDPLEVQERVIQLVETGTVPTIDGTTLNLDVDAIGIHGDTDNAIYTAFRLKKYLNALMKG
jgi:UPF0271 protein